MKQIYQYIYQHFKTDYSPLYYTLTALSIGIFVALNYTFGIERQLRSHYSGVWQVALYVLFYALPYFTVIALQKLTGQDVSYVKKRSFWVQITFVLLLLAFDATYIVSTQLYAICKSHYTGKDLYYVSRLCVALNSLLAMGVPLLLYWLLWGRKNTPSFYGLTWRGFKAQPYLIMLGIMLPIIVGASFFSQFANYYPTLKLYGIQTLRIAPPAVAIAAYEFMYGLDFMWTEVVIRGFMVIGMYRLMGSKAVMPMVALYAFRHFNKPLAETISSVFGGYLLGSIAYRSNNVLGGVFIHAGIAILMDLAAMAQWFAVN